MEISSSTSTQNEQSHSIELCPSKQALTEQEQEQQQPSTIKKKRRKRCHGNQKLRRFKKKCRRRDMSEEEIKRLIDEYNRTKNSQAMNNTTTITTTNAIVPAETTVENMEITTGLDDIMNESTITTRKSNKRKQMTPSSSRQQLTSQQRKKKNSSLITMTPIKRNYRLPKYLQISANVILRALRLHLKHTLKKKNEQHFLQHRLQWIDQQCRLELYQNLWQSYLTLGSKQQIWPNQIYKMAKTHDHALCQQLVNKRLNEIQMELNQCTTELLTQSQSCPSTLFPLITLDQNLTKFVQIQQKYLSNKLNYQLIRYQDIIRENELFQTLSTSILTMDQKNTIDQLIHLRQTQFDHFEKFLQLETRIAIQFLPRNFDHLETSIAPYLYVPIIKDTIAIEFKQKHYKIIQEAKRKWLNIYVDAYEIKDQEYEHQYQQVFHQFQLMNCSNNSPMRNDGTTTTTTTTTTPLFNSFMTYMNHRIHRMTQEIYYEKIPKYRKHLKCLCHRRLREGTQQQQMVNVNPRIILDIFYHPFTKIELAYLSRGPTYIRPNQSALRPKLQRENCINTEHKNIMNKIIKYMDNLKDRTKRQSIRPMYKFYSERLQTYLTLRYMTSLPLMDQLRARRELNIVKSIRRKLKKYKLVLRQTDKSGVLHIGRASDYERKAIEYRQKTGAYELLTSNPFNDTIGHVTRSLNTLKTTNKIFEWQRKKLMPIRDKTELAYMYVIPKPHKTGTPLRPILNTIHAAATKISKFLDQLIRPLFDRFASKTTIIDGTDLLKKLQTYINDGYLLPSTLFITFDISNLYTMLPQEESLLILAEFLHEHQCETVNGISIDTIVELARVVLQTNTFVYNNEFYRQIIGGAMGSPFTLTLANIFMWKWEKQAILPHIPSYEICGRYIDDIFFTSNESEEQVKTILESANNVHPNIKLDYQISTCLPFLDVLLQNNNGIFQSSLYRKPSAEPTILHYLSDHPRHVFRNIIQTALMRAVRYSSTFEAFNYERRNIRLMLLYNGYPSTYINEQFRRFFADYMSSSSLLLLLPLIDNKNQFFILREKLLIQPTAKQTQIATSAATVDIIHHVQNVGQTNTLTMETIIKRKDNKFKNNLFIHCRHEARLEGLAREIHTIHESYFKTTDFGNIRLVVGYRNNPNTQYELVRKRPSSELLEDPLKAKEQNKKKQPNQS